MVCKSIGVIQICMLVPSAYSGVLSCILAQNTMHRPDYYMPQMNCKHPFFNPQDEDQCKVVLNDKTIDDFCVSPMPSVPFIQVCTCPLVIKGHCYIVLVHVLNTAASGKRVVTNLCMKSFGPTFL